ncbi:MAG: hypothetical protein LC114_22670 [Bryobacterales bacterium]|jgi:hypothetical protein|nr:hypothetical protein [Bryobacterales bacterium]
MGDRAYVRLTCRQADAGRFEQIGFVEDCAEGEMAVSMVDEEANYAHYSELIGLAKENVVFCGWHDAGGDYDGAMFASGGDGQYHEALSTSHESLPLVRVKPDGAIVEADMDHMREYYSALACARKTLGMKEDVP